MLHLCEIVSSFEGFFFGTFVIVFVWSQFDAGKIDNRTIGSLQNQEEAKLDNIDQ